MMEYHSKPLAPQQCPPLSTQGNASKRCAPKICEPQSEVHADTLARLGIKARDFAYESTLPPIRPYRVRQVQPGLGDGKSSVPKGPKLERQATEPDLSAISPPSCTRAFANLNDYFDNREPNTYIDTPSVTPDGSLEWEVAGNNSVPALQLKKLDEISDR